MMGRPSLEDIKKDLGDLKDFEVVVFGSYVKEDFNQRSDIDVAVITRRSGEISWENFLKGMV